MATGVKETAEPKKAVKKLKASDLPQLEVIYQELAKRHDEEFLKRYVKIVNKNGDQIPFVLNNTQKRIEEKIKELEAQGIPVRIIVLKYRQGGISTYAQAKFICRTVKNKNRNALVVAHRDDSTNAIFEKAKYIYKHLPAHIQPLQQASNAKELIFDKPPHYKGRVEGLNSRIKVQTAGSEDIGRSDTFFYVHLSEFGFYKGNPKKSLTGILQSVPKAPGTIVIIESTGNGMNDFKDIWDAAEAGENQWVPMFFAWHDDPLNQMPVTEKERIEIMSNLSKYEQEINELFELTAEKIKWYRWMVKNDCNGDEDMMKQENPSFPAESFLSTGRPVFANKQVSLRIEQLKKQYKLNPPKQGSFLFEWNNPETKDKIKDSSIKFVEGFGDYVYIYEEPKVGHPYVIGGDTKGEGSDKFASTALDNSNGKRVATIHSDLAPDEYAHQTYCLGKYYNNALISIEINFDIYPVLELERLKYPNQYKRETIDSISHKEQYKHGWKTDGNTRPMIISNEIVLIRDNIDLFTHIGFLSECLTFVMDKNGRPDAESGKHDDLLFSDMIANASRTQQRMDIKEEKSQLSGVYAYGELKLLGYSDAQIRKLRNQVKVIGGRK